jgi:hypothetical protein
MQPVRWHTGRSYSARYIRNVVGKRVFNCQRQPGALPACPRAALRWCSTAQEILKGVDIWVDLTPENATNVIAALNQCGCGSLGWQVDDFLAGARMIGLSQLPNRAASPIKTIWPSTRAPNTGLISGRAGPPYQPAQRTEPSKPWRAGAKPQPQQPQRFHKKPWLQSTGRDSERHQEPGLPHQPLPLPGTALPGRRRERPQHHGPRPAGCAAHEPSSPCPG